MITIYFNPTTKKIVSPYGGWPAIQANDKEVIEFHQVDSANVPVSFVATDSFELGADINFTHSDDLIFYSTAYEVIDAPGGIVRMTAYTNTDAFNAKITVMGTKSYLHLKRYIPGDALGDTLILDQIAVNPSVMNSEGAPAASNPEYYTAAQVAALLANPPLNFAGYTEKETLADADLAIVSDSADSGAIKKFSLANLWTYISGKAATVYAAITHSHAISDITDLSTALSNKQDALGFTAENAANKGQANGYASLDANGKLAQQVAADKITGVINIDNIPASALERLLVVADDAARYALTVNDAQLGDTVKVAATGLLYMIKDINNLASDTGYEIYAAETAAAVPWTGVTKKPETFPPSTHAHPWDAIEEKPVTFPDATAREAIQAIQTEFAAITSGCVDLSPVVINSGKDNIAGGYGAKIATYSNVATGGATAYRLMLEADEDLDMTKFVIGEQIYINATSMDENSPHVKLIAGVNETNNFVYLDSDIVCDPTSTVIGYNKIALSGYAVMARTSTTSNAIATGSKTFTYTSTVLAWAVGMRLKAVGATATNWMSGIITTFSATSVTINVDLVSGTGTFASWTLDLAGVGAMVGSSCRFTAAAVDDFRAGQNIMIVPTAAGDTDPLQTNTIMHVDTVSNYIYLSSLPVPVAVSFALSGYPASIAAVADATRATPGFAVGEENFVTGEYADASGSINIAHGIGSHAEGINNSSLGAGTHAEGMNNFANKAAAHVEGSGNVAAALAAHAEGIATKATGDAAHAEGQTTLASGDCSHAGGANCKATGRNAFARGTMSEANNDTATAIGYRAKANAKYSTVIGKDITLADAAENESAFAAGAIISRVNKAVLNPLYPADGEPQYLPVPAARAEFAGQLKPISQSITLSGAQTVTLDADKFSRVILAGTGTATLALTNWVDGDKCELVIDTTTITPVIPIAWIMPEIDLSADPRLYVLEIAQIGSSIFVAIKYPDIAESGTSGLELAEHVADNVRHISDTERLAIQAAFDAKANLASPTFTGTVAGITKAMVGLPNADNTSDANKPVSTTQATAIALKVDKVTGKGLSTEDYTTTEKNKLAGIDASANNYSHPANHAPSVIAQDANNRFVTDTEKSTWSGKADTLVVHNPQTGTTYTLVLTDANKLVTMSNVASNTLTVPLNASVAYDVGTAIAIQMINSGVTALYAASGVTINGLVNANYCEMKQWQVITIVKIATNTWLAIGGFSA